MVKGTTLLVAVLFLSLTRPVLASPEAGNGRLDGVLVNKTAGGESVANLEVKLDIYQDNTWADSKTTTSNSSGEFSFSGLPTDPSYAYEIFLTYQEAGYSSERLTFGAGRNSLTIEIPVWEATTDGTAVSVVAAHAVVYSESNSLLVKEYFLFANSGDRTFIGKKIPGLADKRETLKFSLPAGATDFQIGPGLMNCCIILTGTSLTDIMAVPPTGRDIGYSYRLPLNSKEYTLFFRVNYTVGRFDLLLPEQSIRVASDKLTEGEPLVIAGQTYQDFWVEDLVFGDVIAAELSNLSVSGRLNISSWVGLMLAFAIGGAGFIFVRRKKLQLAALGAEPGTAGEALLAEIAELDDRFEAGEIAREEYGRRRSEKKRQLMRLVSR